MARVSESERRRRAAVRARNTERLYDLAKRAGWSISKKTPYHFRIFREGVPGAYAKRVVDFYSTSGKIHDTQTRAWYVLRTFADLENIITYGLEPEVLNSVLKGS